MEGNCEVVIKSRHRGKFQVEVEEHNDLKNSIETGIEKLGFKIEDVHVLHQGKSLNFDDSELLNNHTNTIHILTKMSASKPITFKLTGCGIKKGCEVIFPSNGTVSMLKNEIFKLYQPKTFSSEGMKLILKGCTLNSNELIGEYTGTHNKPCRLLIMSNPMTAKVSSKDVTVEVELPNNRRVSFDIAPTTMMRAVKDILHKHFQAPEPHCFELYSAKSRQPISNQISKIDKVMEALRVNEGDKDNETIGEVLSSTSSNMFLLLPSSLLVINGVNLLVTSNKMLDRTFPYKKVSKKAVRSSTTTSAVRKQAVSDKENQPSDKQSTSDVPSPSCAVDAPGPRPSRPAAHPKERKSKSRKGFAGLKRGFFTPEKKKVTSTSEKALLSAACHECKPLALDFDTPPTGKRAGRSSRCQLCSKRLLAWDLAAGQCRCGGLYCSKHAHFADHDCDFDFATMEKNQLRAKSAISLSSGNYDHI